MQGFLTVARLSPETFPQHLPQHGSTNLMVWGHFVALLEAGMHRNEYLNGFVKLLLLMEYHDITFLLSTQVLEFASYKWKLQFGLSAVADFFQLGEIRLLPVLKWKV